MRQIGIFDESDRLNKLSKLGDPLEKLNQIIDWSIFESILNRALAKEPKGAGGRPPYKYVLLFKILILQRLFNISDDQTEYQINDRMTFMRFLGLEIGNPIPDAKTIWLFRDTLVKAEVIRELFEIFERQLENQGIVTHIGTIVDASFVDAPKQRNHRDENKQIKEGKTPEDWTKPENVNKLRQKDVDARWTKKGNETHFGYKDHAKVDMESKIITDYEVTSASVHDSQEFIDFLDPKKDKAVYADSAYSGNPIAEQIPEQIENQIHEKGYRKSPLTEEQRDNNRQKSRVRARIEHVFGFMTGSMHGITLRCIGLRRAAFNIGLTNLIYNMCRYGIILRKKTLDRA